MSNSYEASFGKNGWYPTDKLTLKTTLNTYLSNVPAPTSGNILGLICPHAGLIYSGQTAAYGFKQVQKKQYDRIIILSPSHYFGFSNSISVCNFDSCITPLGNLVFDRAMANTLSNSDSVETRNDVISTEHGIEMMFPWISVCLPNTPILPLVLGSLSFESVSRFAWELQQIHTDKTLYIVSSDFIHYGAAFDYVPFTTNVPLNIDLLDKHAFQLISKKSSLDFYNFSKTTHPTICGKHAISTLLLLLQDHHNVQTLHTTNTGIQTDNWQQVVSYASMLIGAK